MKNLLTGYICTLIGTPVLFYSLYSYGFYLERLRDPDIMVCFPGAEILTLFLLVNAFVFLIWTIIIRVRITERVTIWQRLQIAFIGIISIAPCLFLDIYWIAMQGKRIFRLLDIMTI